MEPIIYALPKINDKIELNKSNFYFDENPSPKLIKYGFNNITDSLDLASIIAVPQHRAGLKFDFERRDANSITTRASTELGLKKFNQNFAEIWEILSLFGLLDKSQTIATNHPDILQNITKLYEQITSTKTNSTVADLKSKTASLVVYKYSDIDIDENAAIDIIISHLPNLLPMQNPGASMVIQLFSLQTQTSAEIIYYLSSLYDAAYLVKPTISSDLSDSKYLVLIGLKEKSSIDIPSHAENIYLASMGIDSLQNDFVTKIQCMNAKVIPAKYSKYIQIKNFLDTKVYEGSAYQEMMEIQNNNTNKWIRMFTDKNSARAITDAAIQLTDKHCANYNKLVTLLN